MKFLHGKIISDRCPKQIAYENRYYQKNKEEVKRRAVLRTKKIRADQHRLVARYKLKIGCKICTYKKCHQALELHHVRGRKRKDVCSLIHTNVPTRVIKEEVRKCIVLCGNCHRELHAKGQTNSKVMRNNNAY